MNQRLSIPAVLLVGIPDDRRVELLLGPDMQPVPNYPGTACFITQTHEALAKVQRLHVGPGFVPKLRSGKPPSTVINYIADADQCGIALQVAQSLVGQWQANCFNPVAAVQATTRDRSSDLLTGIDGVQMPRTLRIKPRSEREIFDAIDAADLGYPLLVRIAGAHGGTEMVRLDNSQDRERLYDIPWGGRTLYITRFHDFADADGHYRKLRLAVVGDQYFPRHLVVGEDWLLHADSRGKQAQQEETGFLAAFDQHTRPLLDAPMRHIIDRVGLDYFGIDCSLRPDGSLLIFEANACMNILHNSQPSPNIWDTPIARIRDALLQRLSHPQRWMSSTGAVKADPSPA